ncbi:MAG: PDZ domain-containing protein [Acidobacteriota bacterium]
MTLHSKMILAALLLALPLPSHASERDDSPKVVVIDQGDAIEIDGGQRHRTRVFGHGNRAWLGIDLIEVTPELRVHWGAPKDAGVLVGTVEKDGPAARAGVQVGDLVTSIDGKRVSETRELIRAMRDKNAGDAVQLDLSRQGASKSLRVTVAARPERDFEISGFGPRLEREIERSLPREFSRWVDAPDGVRGGRTDEMRRIRERVESLEKRLRDLEGKGAH